MRTIKHPLTFIIFFIVACITSNTGCHLFISHYTPPVAVHSPGSEVVIPFEIGGPAIIPAYINGKGPFRCLVDTGSRGCAISMQVAKSVSPWAGFKGKEGLFVNGELIKVTSWNITNVSFHNFHAIIADTGDVDCILGCNALQNSIVGWDSVNGLFIFDIDPKSITQDTVMLPVKISGGRPFLTASFNDKETKAAMIAPGLPQSSVSPAFAAKLADDSPDTVSGNLVIKGFERDPVKTVIPVVESSFAGLFRWTPSITIASDVLFDTFTIIDIRGKKVYFNRLKTNIIDYPGRSDMLPDTFSVPGRIDEPVDIDKNRDPSSPFFGD